MIKKMIENKINNLSIGDINNFCNSNNVHLDESEKNIIFNYIKNNWEEICYKDSSITLNKCRTILKPTTYQKASELLNIYKKKI